MTIRLLGVLQRDCLSDQPLFWRNRYGMRFSAFANDKKSKTAL